MPSSSCKPKYKLKLDGTFVPLPFHPETIKAAVRIQGKSGAVLAEELGVSPTAVSAVIRGATKSKRIRAAVAGAIGLPPELIWVEGNPKPQSVRQLIKRAAA
jgi:lambda repressor-like predicted transcriptional regulator